MDSFMGYIKQLLNFSMIIYLHVFVKEFYGVVISQTGNSPWAECSILLDKPESIPGIIASFNHLRKLWIILTY